MKDKIIQITSSPSEPGRASRVHGLSETGKLYEIVYKGIDSYWKLVCDSPETEKRA